MDSSCPSPIPHSPHPPPPWEASTSSLEVRAGFWFVSFFSLFVVFPLLKVWLHVPVLTSLSLQDWQLTLAWSLGSKDPGCSYPCGKPESEFHETGLATGLPLSYPPGLCTQALPASGILTRCVCTCILDLPAQKIRVPGQQQSFEIITPFYLCFQKLQPNLEKNYKDSWTIFTTLSSQSKQMTKFLLCPPTNGQLKAHIQTYTVYPEKGLLLKAFRQTSQRHKSFGFHFR